MRNYKEEFTNPDFKRTLKQNAIPQKNIPSIENTEIKIEKTYHILDFKQIKEAVDESVRLKKKCFSQAQKRKELDQKLAELEAEIRNKTNKINKAKKSFRKN
ncbi:hypothetical protein NQ317_014395 [Molorchus minor]|uniref:Uncharacterized protein n=1 Tax=Molorchus minor TaxID=1323400 RepID=A0ABQ9K6U3_9CUCU|nr:hypothetical protein NQ317_014395 [Molorchus minor]